MTETTPMQQPRRLGFAAAAIAALFTCAASAEPKTDITELVMYGIDADTYELLRYTFHDDNYTRIGKVTDENDNVVEDVESLCYIPSGPYKGFYGGANFYEETPSRLVKINAMDARGVMLPQAVGFAKIEGMVAVLDGGTGEWFILATTQGEYYDDGDTEGDPCLIRINPATGRGTKIRETAENFEGLAMGLDGTVLGTYEDELYEIDLASGNDNRTSSGHDLGKTEALEWAFGDAGALGINTDGLCPGSWTTNGILFGFSDDEDALLIMDPDSGDAVKYPCSFATVDCEGLVFTTRIRDAFGEVVSEPCD